MKRLLKAPFIAIGRRYIRSLCDNDWDAARRGAFIGGQNERPVEYAFALRALNDAAPKRVLDVGTGRTAWPHLLATCGFAVSAIDQSDDYWRDRLYNRHWPVLHDDVRAPKIDGRFDAITCLSVLEHIPDHKQAVRGMFSILNPGGIVVISVPYNPETYCPDVYREPEAGYGRNNKYIAQVYSRRELDGWLSDNAAKLISEQYYRAFTGRLWTFGERIIPLAEAVPNHAHLGCFVLAKAR